MNIGDRRSSFFLSAAQDQEAKRKVAIKKITHVFEDMVDAKRILREVRMLAHFDHPNVKKIFLFHKSSLLNNFNLSTSSILRIYPAKNKMILFFWWSGYFLEEKETFFNTWERNREEILGFRKREHVRVWSREEIFDFYEAEEVQASGFDLGFTNNSTTWKCPPKKLLRAWQLHMDKTHFYFIFYSVIVLNKVFFFFEKYHFGGKIVTFWSLLGSRTFFTRSRCDYAPDFLHKTVRKCSYYKLAKTICDSLSLSQQYLYFLLKKFAKYIFRFLPSFRLKLEKILFLVFDEKWKL